MVCIFATTLAALSRAISTRIDEELIFLDEFITDKSLDDLILQYRRKLERYAAFSDEVHCYRVILRDYESRRVFTAKL